MRWPDVRRRLRVSMLKRGGRRCSTVAVSSTGRVAAQKSFPSHARRRRARIRLGRDCGPLQRVRRGLRGRPGGWTMRRRSRPIERTPASSCLGGGKFDEGAGVSLDERHGQRRWSLTRPDTGRLRSGPGPSRGYGRCAVARQSRLRPRRPRCLCCPAQRARSEPHNSVMTTSPPARARSSQSLRCARNSL